MPLNEYESVAFLIDNVEVVIQNKTKKKLPGQLCPLFFLSLEFPLLTTVLEKVPSPKNTNLMAIDGAFSKQNDFVSSYNKLCLKFTKMNIKLKSNYVFSVSCE